MSPQVKVKINKLPRGKPFEPGNTLSLPYRFPPGVSGNPGGRPKTKQINASARKQLAADVRKAPRIETEADLIVAAQLRKARKGDLGAAAFLADRAEGRPAVAISVDGGGEDPLIELIAYMHAESDRLGPPEATVQEVLTDGREQDN
jgi:hypothetical protein